MNSRVSIVRSVVSVDVLSRSLCLGRANLYCVWFSESGDSSQPLPIGTSQCPGQGQVLLSDQHLWTLSSEF